MLENRTETRQHLSKLSRSNMWDIVSEINMDDDDIEILDLRFVRHIRIKEISTELNCSVEKVNKTIAKFYDKVYDMLYRQ